MHFRVRKNVIQLIRGVYDPHKKKGVAQIVGSVRLDDPVLSQELSSLMTSEEVDAFQQWINTLHRTEQLKAELAALTLAEQMKLANTWFAQQANNNTAAQIGNEIQTAWQALRRTLNQTAMIT